ncbi:MAG: hypothetical protein ABSE46_01825 [Terracidiphilus sp.]|jgi:hypothetical protein
MNEHRSSVISDVNQVAMDWARDHAGERLGTKWYDGEFSFEPSDKWPVSESVRLAVRKIMTDAFSREVPRRDLVESIRIAGEFTIEEAKLIADTEIKMAQSHGNLAAWKRTGVVKSTKWLKSMLHTVRDCCDLNVEAGTVPIGQPFPSGDECPPAHIGCRCGTVIAELNEVKRKVEP